ncbi:MAG: PAS domain-containing protein [Deltaproteobacteria bacterium]|nr:PAS domain-containing protein [Deltaproteobacteria bacterium]
MADERLEITRKALWMLFVRVIIVTVLLAATILINFNSIRLLEDPLQLFLIGLVILVYGVTIPLALLARHPGRNRMLSTATIGVDLFLAAGLVYATGAEESAFTFLFSLAVINAAIIGHRKGALITTVLTIVVFATESILVREGLLPDLSGSISHSRPLSAFMSTLLVNSFAFFLVAYLASYLAEAKRQADETAEKRLKDLTKLEELHKCIVQSIDSGILALDNQGRITLANPAAFRILKQPSSKLIGVELEKVIEGMSPPGRLQVTPFSNTKEVILKPPGDDERHLEMTVNPLFDTAGEIAGSLVVVRDLTEIKSMERNLMRSEKLAALGELSASLAHELRNPLASMSGSIQLLKSELKMEGEYKKLMEIVVKEADRLDNLVQDFLSFARPAAPVFQHVDLAGLLSDTVKLVGNDSKFSKKAPLSLSAPGRLVVRGDPNQLTQVFLNLLYNALEATKQGGEVTIKVETERGKIRVVIEDQGPGLTKENISRAFDPFFTTKESGTGLGLSVVHSIIENHGGGVSIENRLQGGCRVTVELPPVKDLEDDVSEVIS